MSLPTVAERLSGGLITPGSTTSSEEAKLLDVPRNSPTAMARLGYEGRRNIEASGCGTMRRCLF
ncbi:MAG: hypothetical protein QJR12_06990 [Mycobacterium sp.]|uniref:hypothetical protein n=1 Tax=Mycobacterium sp. TaxID=1785 RepID=UPI00261465E8|nr:hypothetical protein [Mycobacterium sp.]MDI3314019.1 hypothetical protein [Mycobacterium sp.]